MPFLRDGERSGDEEQVICAPLALRFVEQGFYLALAVAMSLGGIALFAHVVFRSAPTAATVPSSATCWP